MKIVCFNGSPHEDGRTFRALKCVADELEARGIETELAQVGGKLLYGCRCCGYCGREKNGLCAFGEKDGMNELLKKAVSADGIILGSPVYFGNMTSELKAFIDRLGCTSRNGGQLLKGKLGAAVVTARRGGANFTYASISFLFGITQMITVNSSYWNTVHASIENDLEPDGEGTLTLRQLGENMAELLHRLNG